MFFILIEQDGYEEDRPSLYESDHKITPETLWFATKQAAIENYPQITDAMMESMKGDNRGYISHQIVSEIMGEPPKTPKREDFQGMNLFRALAEKGLELNEIANQTEEIQKLKYEAIQKHTDEIKERERLRNEIKEKINPVTYLVSKGVIRKVETCTVYY